MDKDRIVGSAKDFAGKVESTVGDMAGDAKTQAEGRAREAAGTVQNLYGQAKDVARDATDAAVNYAKDAYENSGDTVRSGQQAVAKTVQDNPLGALFCAGRICIGGCCGLFCCCNVCCGGGSKSCFCPGTGATVPLGDTAATGVSPLACSRPISRRGQA